MKKILVVLLIAMQGCAVQQYRCEAEDVVYYAEHHSALVIMDDEFIAGNCDAL